MEYQSLSDILSLYQNDEKKGNFITLFEPQRCINVGPHDLGSFWENYCDLLHRRIAPLYLAEISGDNIPIVVDIRLCFSEKVDDDIDDVFLYHIIHAIQTIIDDTLEIKDGDDVNINFNTVFISKNQERDKKSCKSIYTTEYRIHFPFCRPDKVYQQKVMKPELIKRLTANETLAHIGDLHEVLIKNRWEDILSINTSTYYPLYGSVDGEKKNPFIIHGSYGVILSEHLNSDNDRKVHSPTEPIDDVFKLDEHSLVQQGIIPKTIFQTPGRPLSFWYPLFFSQHHCCRINLMKKENIELQKHSVIDCRPSVEKQPKEKTPKTEFTIHDISKLLDILRPSRALDNNHWMDIGKVLYNTMETIGKTLDEGLKLWSEWSEFITVREEYAKNRSNKTFTLHTKNDCKALYYTFNTDNNLTIKTLAWYARQDNREKYDAWHYPRCSRLLNNAVREMSHADVAKAFHQIYWLDYVCSKVKGGGTWYKYEKKVHGWREADEGVDLRLLLTEGFRAQFHRVREDNINQSKHCDDEHMITKMEETNKRISTLICKLGHNSFKNSVMKEAMLYFYDRKFERNLDNNPNMMGNDNCVFEIICKKVDNKSYGNVYVRDGKPEDFISMTTHIHYPFNDLSESSPARRLKGWLAQLFPDPNMFNCFMRWCASLLKGRNSDKLFAIWKGEGDNAKSLLLKLLFKALGMYAIKCPTTVLSAKPKNAGSASPETARMKGVHLAACQECDKGDNLQANNIKEKTGGDTFYTRSLYSNGGDIENFLKFLLVCNQIPPTNNHDRATRERFFIMPLLTQYSLNAPKDPKEQQAKRLYPIDNNFENYIPEMAPIFLYMMVEAFTDYMEFGLETKKCQDIVDATRDYWEKNDVYLCYINKNIEAGIPSKDGLGINEIYANFKDWFQYSYPGQRNIPNLNTVEEALISRWGPRRGAHWMGIKFKENNSYGNIAVNI